MSDTHSDIGFQLAEKEGEGTERRMSQQNSIVEKVFHTKRSSESGDQRLQNAAGKGLGRERAETTMNQTDRIGQLLQKSVAGTRRDVSQCFPSSDLASLDKVHRWRPCPPA